MPFVFRAVLRYYDNKTNLGWNIVNHLYKDTYDDVKDAANLWNTKYLACCGQNIFIKDLRVSEIETYRDLAVYGPSNFAETSGGILEDSTEISSYAQWRGYGDDLTMSSAGWKLHGMAASLVASSKFLDGDADASALNNASLVYFQQYRKNATAHLPGVPIPQDFAHQYFSGMYGRRLGRPFGLPGQTQRFPRVVA